MALQDLSVDRVLSAIVLKITTYYNHNMQQKITFNLTIDKEENVPEYREAGRAMTRKMNWSTEPQNL